MLIDLSNVLSEPHRSVDETVPCELKIFRNGLGEYPVTESSDVHVKINYMENGKLQIEGTCKLTVEIPCDRCLEPVATVFDLNISRITKGNVTDERRCNLCISVQRINLQKLEEIREELIGR